MKKITDIISQGIKKLISPNVKGIEESNHPKLDIREEYANAFRTESYVEFWERVLELSEGHHPTSQASVTVSGSTTGARLSSYRLFVDHLLDPDQPTVFQALNLMPSRPTTQSNLLLDYFSETANAFNIFSQLLKNLDHIRIKYKPLKLIFDSAQIIDLSVVDRLHVTLTNPLIVPVLFPDTSGIETVQAKCSDLLSQLESSRETSQAKLQLVFKLVSCKKLSKWINQLDAAAKGTYIIIRDLDTVPRLVARLIDELEYIQTMIEMLANKGDQERLQGGGEVVRQLKISYVRFCEQMDELEEHLYLCLMTVNRARNLLFKEILDQVKH